ncbi:gliding motility lipoprotein GldH [Polaribacter sp. KT 15]|uniref:gliding motility lipoprotein GldH n=1 Tax=Polaribacter sp. KT 15 TaxID=1896175 RepID=UPI00090BB5AB|nr:gliding motility lipoprotein GldH [Polaribacter sp. KT 15]SHM87610.1 protein involved in gliding motility GldH [Polaribacter sp. KT 15]
METIQKNKILLFVGFFFLMISCQDVSEFNQYKTLEDGSWKSNQDLTFNFEVKDTIRPKNLFINIRNNNEYEYSNLFIITTLKFPNNTTVIDTLQYEMADEKGVFLGSGFSSIKENKLFYKEEKVFPTSGNYVLSVKQAMRKNGEINEIKNLKGILDVGLTIEKINE